MTHSLLPLGCKCSLFTVLRVACLLLAGEVPVLQVCYTIVWNLGLCGNGLPDSSCEACALFPAKVRKVCGCKRILHP